MNNLQTVDFTSNDCINQKFGNRSEVELMLPTITENCGFDEIMDDLALELTLIKSMLTAQQESKSYCDSQVTYIQEINKKLDVQKEEIDKLQAKIDHLTDNYNTV